jgi:branched-chain amino acid transport system substrate-binding protein
VLKRAFVVLLLVGFGLYFFVFRTLYYKAPAYERSGVSHDWLDRGFSIALVWPRHSEPSLIEGATMALDEVNSAGGPLANKIRLRSFEESDSGRTIAQDVIAYKDVVAVIGHELESTSIRSSLTYERHGVLYLATKSSDVRLTEHDFKFVFRFVFDDKDYTHALAQFAVDRGWKRVAVLFGRADHGEAASAQFLVAAKQLDLAVPIVRSYFHDPDWNEEDFRPMLAEVRAKQFDALMIADELPWAGKLLIDMKRMGVTQPILSTNKLDSSNLYPIAQDAANNLYVASAVDNDSVAPVYVAFRQRFKRRFGTDPTSGAIQGYEALKLFVDAATKSASADPVVVATTLKTNTWQGLFGEVKFRPNGDIRGRTIEIKRVQNGVMTTVAAEKDLEE